MTISGKLPYIVFDDFYRFPEAERDAMIKDIFESKEKYVTKAPDSQNAWTTANYITVDNTGNFQKLYDMIWFKAEEVFGPLHPNKINAGRCAAYTVSNRYWGFNPHQHNCDINVVYYLRVPPVDNELYGSLWMTESIDEPSPWDHIVPKEGTLVFMDPKVWHDPFPVPHKEHRVSINLEFCTKERIDPQEYHDWNLRYI